MRRRTFEIVATLALVAVAGFAFASSVVSPSPVPERVVSPSPVPERVDVTDEYDSEQLRIDYEIAIDLIEPVYRGEPEIFCADYWADPWRHVNDFVDGFLSQAPDEIGYLVSRTQMIHDIETRILRACPGA